MGKSIRTGARPLGAGEDWKRRGSTWCSGCAVRSVRVPRPGRRSSVDAWVCSLLIFGGVRRRASRPVLRALVGAVRLSSRPVAAAQGQLRPHLCII